MGGLAVDLVGERPGVGHFGAALGGEGAEAESAAVGGDDADPVTARWEARQSSGYRGLQPERAIGRPLHSALLELVEALLGGSHRCHSVGVSAAVERDPMP